MKFARHAAFGHSAAAPRKNSDTMSTLSRRSFLAASAALAAAPALGAVPASGDVDVAIVGAGAAGIAAARRVAAAKRRFALLEAGNRIGGRCVTDTTIFGVPFDLGAHWIHNPDGNPLAQASPSRARHLSGAARADWCASVRAMRATPSWKISWPRWCARIAPSPMPAAPRRMWRRRRCRAISATGRERSNSCSGPMRCGKDLDGGLRHRSRPRRRARHRRILPAGLWRAAREACRRSAGAAGDAGHTHRHGTAAASTSRRRKASCAHAR